MKRVRLLLRSHGVSGHVDKRAPLGLPAFDQAASSSREDSLRVGRKIANQQLIIGSDGMEVSIPSLSLPLPLTLTSAVSISQTPGLFSQEC